MAGLLAAAPAALLIGAGAGSSLGGGGSATRATGSSPGVLGAPAPGVTAPAAERSARRAYARLPLRFEENRGQTDGRVRFLARGAGYGLFLTDREAVLSLAAGGSETRRGAVLRMRLLGAAASPRPVGEHRLPGSSNYLAGRSESRWRRGVPAFGRVRYPGAYPGIDVVYYGRQGRLEYDFRVKPGADPRRIKLGFEGARGIQLDRAGDLLISTAAGTVRQLRPVLYQRVGSKRRRVAGRYAIESHGRIGLRVGPYDHRRALVVDPVVAYSTYLGGGFGEFGNAVAVDASGSAYVAGFSSSLDFPTTAGAFQTKRAGDPASVFLADAFVAKLNPQGSALVYSTYLGGGDFDSANGIALDGTGRAYLAGDTSSADFPTRRAFQATLQRAQSGFVSVLSADGSDLDYSTYLGGADGGGMTVADVAVDAARKAYVTGRTDAIDFPVGPPGVPFQSVAPGGGDGFVAKLDPAGSGASSRVWATYFGGTGFDFATDIAVDSSGRSYLTGGTSSSDLPLQSPAQGVNNGESDGFVAKLNAQGSGLAYSTYLGGSAFDVMTAITIDSSNRAYVTGNTPSTDFPTTPGAFQTARAGDPSNLDSKDAVVARLGAAGSLGYSSYLGGAANEEGDDIAVDGTGAAHVIGSSDRDARVLPPGGKFPTVDPFAPTGPQGDAFVTKVKPDGTGLSFSSTFGGGGDDAGKAIALDNAGSGYLVGQTFSTDFPTRDPLQARNAGGGFPDNRDAFVVKLSAVDASAPLVTSLRRRSGPPGTSVVVSGHGLSGATEVRFGAVRAPRFTVDSSEQITAESPPHAAGPVAVTVTTPAGASPANPVARFTYAEGRWDATGSLRIARESGQTATRLADGRVLVAGGQSGAESGFAALRSAELYDPGSGTWSATGPLPAPRFGHKATLLADGRVLVAGGFDANQNTLGSAALYDPTSGRWSPTGAMRTPRMEHTATLLSDGRVLVAGGRRPTFEGPLETLGSYELYDPGSGTWSPLATLRRARSKHTATLLDGPQCQGSSGPAFCGDVLIVGGLDADGFELDAADLYDAGTDAWSDTGALGVGRSLHTATLLRNGRVLIAGGDSRNLSKPFADLYDPATGRFSTTSLMGVPRADHGAALLPSGKVLVAGGRTNFSFLDSAEVYDPASARWGPAGVMTHYRAGQSGTPSVFALALPNGKVLAGGDGGSAGASTELYTPEQPGPLGGPPPGGETTAGPDRTRPNVTGLRVIPRRFRRGVALPRLLRRFRTGTQIRFRLSEAAAVRLRFARASAGRRVGRRCIRSSPRLRRRPSCIRHVAVRPSLRLTAPDGLNRVRFRGRLSRSRRLRPGNYRLTVTATDRAGNHSKPRRTGFVLLPRKVRVKR